jgi:hypothetical protein
MLTAVHPKSCRQCAKEFTPTQPMQAVCGWRCATSEVVAAAKAKKAAEKARDSIRLDALQTKPQLVKKAQLAFNAFVRARDADKPCISCAKLLQAGSIGGGYDCGHYRSVGSAVHMRFVEDNAHGQCKHCNRHLAGNHVAYRAALLARIGLRSLELLEADQTLRKYTREGLAAIAKHYNAEARKLKAAKPK